MSEPFRICPSCQAGQPIRHDEQIWPKGWFCPACSQTIAMQDGIAMFAPDLAGALIGMNPASFAPLADVEAGNYWFEPRNQLIGALISRYFSRAESLLEIGCGSGFVLSKISEIKRWRHLVGSELQPAGLKIAQSRLGTAAEFVQMDARHIPAESAFDVVGAFDVLEHIAEDEAVLASMYRALRPDGGIVLAVPQHPWLWSPVDDIALHVRRYRRGELERKVRNAGFKVEFSASYTSLLLPAMAVSRLRSRKTPTGVACQSEFHVSKILNDCLKWLLRMEVRLTLKGVRWVAGGSRFVVATKEA